MDSKENDYDHSNFYYFNYFRFANLIENKKFELKIIELNDDQKLVDFSSGNTKTTDEGSSNVSGNSQEIPVKFLNSGDRNNSNNDDYLVEEPEESTPFDFVFEPEHYKYKFKINSQYNSDEDEATIPMHDSQNGAPTQVNNKRKLNDEQSSNGKFPIDRTARFKGENKDGVLEYEYLSGRYTKTPNIEISDQSTECDYLNKAYYNEFDLKHHHLNAIVRGISLVKWPTTGYGFTMTRSTNDNYIYINNISVDSPAEFCLQVGDIIIEIDEMCPEKDFKSLDEIDEYLDRVNFVHLMVVHESKFFNLGLLPKCGEKSFYDHSNLLRDYCINCRDIVIVNWPKVSNKKQHQKQIDAESNEEPMVS